MAIRQAAPAGMRRSRRFPLRRGAGLHAALLLHVLAACLPSASAIAGEGQRVHRCIGNDGEVVFSGLPCSTPRPGTEPAMPEAAAAAATACPSHRDELFQRLRHALERQDANAIAALMDWRGIGAAAATSRMSDMERLVKQPLLDLRTDGEAIDLRTGGVGHYTQRHFMIEEHAGCLWLGW